MEETEIPEMLPIPPPPPSPPMPAIKPKRKGKIIAVIVIAVVIIAAVFAAYWFLWNGEEKKVAGKGTYKELWKDYSLSEMGFKSYDSGDTYEIIDTVWKIEYNESIGKTAVWFESVHGTFWEGAPPIYLDGNKTGMYSLGDPITITVHIIEFFGMEVIQETMVISTGSTEEVTPNITLIHTSTTNDTNYVNITWMVAGVSRSDVKWSDVPTTSMKVFVNGIPKTADITLSTSSIYITGADTIKVQLAVGDCPSGSTVKLVLVYAPSGSTCAEATATASY